MNLRRDRRSIVGRAALLPVLALLAACTTGGQPSATPQPQPSGCQAAGPVALAGTAGPTWLTACTTSPRLPQGELRLVLIERLGPRWYCDPDEYPVSQGSEQERAIERYPEMVAEGDVFGAIGRRLGIWPGVDHDDAQKLAIYRLWKVASTIQLDPVGDGRYRFDYLAKPLAGAAQGTRTAGLISDFGVMTIEQQTPAGEPMCPICLARGSLIEAPDGAVPVERLRIGDVVWTLDREGRRVEGTVLALGSATAPRGHTVVRLVLEDGRSATASPGHPLADGRLLGDLRVGDAVAGSRVAGVEREPYSFGATFDLLVSGETGTYLVGGIPLGTTLAAND